MVVWWKLVSVGEEDPGADVKGGMVAYEARWERERKERRNNGGMVGTRGRARWIWEGSRPVAF